MSDVASSSAWSVNPHHRRGVSLMLASAACFTTNVLLIRSLSHFEAVSVWLVCCARFVVGMGVVFLLYRNDLKLGRLFTHGKLITRGVIGGGTVFGFYLTVLHLGAGRATFINNTYVVFGALLAVAILGEQLRRALIIGSIGSLIGLALLTNAFAGQVRPSMYDLIGIVTAFGAGYVVVTIRQLHATEHTSTIFAAQCVYGLFICGAPALIHPQLPSLIPGGLIIVAGVFAALGQIAMTHAFRHLSVAEGSLLQMLVPLGIAVGGVVFFHERFAPHELVGAGLILAGTIFAIESPLGRAAKATR